MAFYKKKTNYKNNKKMNWIERYHNIVPSGGGFRDMWKVRRRIISRLQICPSTFNNWEREVNDKPPAPEIVAIIDEILDDYYNNRPKAVIPSGDKPCRPPQGVVPADILASPQK